MKYLLLDISGIIYRAFFGMNVNKFKRSDGLHTNAIYGTVNILKQLNKKFPEHTFIACCDCKRSDLERTKENPDYKQNRQEKHPELIEQFEHIYNAISAMNIRQIKVIGHEADDILASLCNKFNNEHDEVIVATSDKDMNQLLVYPNVKIYNPKTKEYVTEEQVTEKFNVTPGQFTFYQAFLGDTADNIKGVKGIGPKTAAKLVKQYTTVEAFQNDTEGKYFSSMEDFNKALKLVTLKTDVDIKDEPFTLQNMKSKEFKDFCKSMEIK